MAHALIPREHGAYAQLGFPLVNALWLGDARPAALALAGAAVAVFLVHEPVLVLLGERGPRAQRELGASARRWVASAGAAAAGCGAAGLALAMPLARWLCVVPLVLAGAVAVLVARREEKSTAGELLAALALTATSLPVAAAGGVDPGRALLLWAAWVGLYASATLAVRGIIAAGRAARARAAARDGRTGEDPPGTLAARAEGWWARLASALLALAAVAGVALAARALGRPAFAAGGLALWVLGSLGLLVWPVSPRQLRRLGWTLVACSVVQAVVLHAALAAAR